MVRASWNTAYKLCTALLRLFENIIVPSALNNFCAPLSACLCLCLCLCVCVLVCVCVYDFPSNVSSLTRIY